MRVNYREPDILWLVLPILLFWLGRIWLLAVAARCETIPEICINGEESLACAFAIARWRLSRATRRGRDDGTTLN